ncbi:MAG: ChaN family lipoprotein [Planctomycetes bacterium]|nr:ChaN family lipoprotein [Planctomycetota bacterium]MCB9903389.1 ChaN family lipoprotein [Planctomycetota bacterium]
MKSAHTLLVLSLVVLGTACRSTDSGRVEQLEPSRSSSIERAAELMADADVVYLGEEHDNDVGHSMQLAFTEELFRRRPGLIVSMEQFEADVQVFLDAYLAGELDEETFLAFSRPWPNYPEHYRPVIEWAKRSGVPVVAANVPRRYARTVAYQGLGSTDYSLWTPWSVHTDEPPYLARFMVAMGGNVHDAPNSSLLRWFAAQCIKDDMMAQSIVEALDRAQSEGVDAPLVVHWCGRFHSDYGLGTVSRVALRRPNLDQRVVSMVSGKEDGRPAPDGLVLGDFVMRVPDQD